MRIVSQFQPLNSFRPQKSKTVRLSSRGTTDLSDEDEEEEEELSDAEESYEHVVCRGLFNIYDSRQY